eukprot:TRINITY_DN3004_c0_g1_i1.p1 TRINITY_DN3004_c0_g1~~TRINITY_DN3004_c0_g1_i1.p1  ORF type:complete len:138 (+),score=10.68 TRINITY_DN3004_c0_g1_i1:291-704(+)
MDLSIIVNALPVQGEYLDISDFTMSFNLPKVFSGQNLSSKESAFIYDEKEAVTCINTIERRVEDQQACSQEVRVERNNENKLNRKAKVKEHYFTHKIQNQRLYVHKREYFKDKYKEHSISYNSSEAQSLHCNRDAIK